MTPVAVSSWEAFRKRLLDFAKLPRHEQDFWWFRGQAEASHELVPTIDRVRDFASDQEREKFIEDLQKEFRREVIALERGSLIPLDDTFELISRHHGLPSPLLDWSRSPWIACLFAYLGAGQHTNANVAIYALDRRRISPTVLQPLGQKSRPQIELMDNVEKIKSIPRALRQRGVFIRRSTMTRSVADLLGGSLVKFELPSSEKSIVLHDLDQMLLNETMLMYDLDAAARTAAWRLA